MARYFWDTNHYIYLFEANPLFQPAVMRLRQQMIAQRDELLTSAMTLGEIQVKGLKDGQPQLAANFRQRVLATSQIISFDAAAEDAFAYIRSTTKMRGADAIHLACAMATGIDYFITNDTDMQKLTLPGIGQITSAQQIV